MIRLLGLLALAAAIALALQAFAFQVVRVKGSSMEGTLHDGEILLVSRACAFHWGEIARGDIILCRYPGHFLSGLSLNAGTEIVRHDVFVKRLVALPGDTVEIRGGHLYVNGERIADPERMGSVPRDYSLTRLGENEYFVMGDHRFASLDSRSEGIGPIGREMIMGRAEWVIWPLGSIRRAK